MSNIFHIKPIYKEFIWGGRKLIDYFHLPQSLEQIGTIYHVIAVPGHLDNLSRSPYFIRQIQRYFAATEKICRSE